jgi:two-component system phosphate regulon sensor histidine kinase PhoR
MHAEAMRMARLIDDLLSLARVEIDEHVPPRDHVPLGEILATTAETLGARAAAKGMALALDCPPDLPMVIGDDDQLVQVFHNLVDNAVKYGRPGTPIRIEARVVDRHPEAGVAGVVVAVSDQGDGIAAEHLPRLTERFYRADAGRSRRVSGTGLGLAIVKHIVNRHRGQLVIASEQGIGTTVTVFLRGAGDEGTGGPAAV